MNTHQKTLSNPADIIATKPKPYRLYADAAETRHFIEKWGLLKFVIMTNFFGYCKQQCMERGAK